MRSRWFFIVLLGALLALAGCATEEGALPGEPEVAGFEFVVDPEANRVALVEQRGAGLVPAVEGRRVLIPGTEIELAYFDYEFLPGDVLEIYASFQNVTEEAYFMGLSFTPTQTPEEGNYLSSVEPRVYHEDLGNGSLKPGEVTRENCESCCGWCPELWFTFEVTHKGEPFSYFMDVSAVVGGVPDVTGDRDPLSQGDKLLYVGGGTPPDLENQYWHGYTMVRTLADGSLDTTFGTGGIASVKLFENPDGDASVYSALQSDNHILVWGDGPMPYKSSGYAARHSPDGELLAHAGIPGSDWVYVFSLTILPGDKVVITGGSIRGWRLYTTPELSTIGVIFPGASLVQPDGKTVYGGGSGNTWGDPRVVRTNPDGTLDTGFGSEGFVTIDVCEGHERISAMELQPDGSIVATGSHVFGSFSVLVHPDGTYDSPVCDPP